MAEETGDYPFKSWDTFFNAFEESLKTEFYEESFPKYAKLLEKGYTNYDIIKHVCIKHEADPTHGLQRYIESICFEGTRYGPDALDMRVINFLVRKGAAFPLDLLLDFEEPFDHRGYQVRAAILDYFGPKLELNVSEYIDWNTVEACYIEDDGNEDLEFELKISHLKYLSDYLKNQ